MEFQGSSSPGSLKPLRFRPVSIESPRSCPLNFRGGDPADPFQGADPCHEIPLSPRAEIRRFQLNPADLSPHPEAQAPKIRRPFKGNKRKNPADICHEGILVPRAPVKPIRRLSAGSPAPLQLLPFPVSNPSAITDPSSAFLSRPNLLPSSEVRTALPRGGLRLASRLSPQEAARLGALVTLHTAGL